MWNYEKRLQYPVNISTPNPKIAQVILSQFGGPDGELAASMRYLSQRYTILVEKPLKCSISGAPAFFSGLPCGQFTLFATV